MYCFSGVVVVVVVGGGVNVCRVFAFRSFLRTIKAVVMNLWSCIHLEESS